MNISKNGSAYFVCRNDRKSVYFIYYFLLSGPVALQLSFSRGPTDPFSLTFN
jgi:hypothetical protein